MKTVRGVFGRRKVSGDIGIEIEAEGSNLPTNVPRYWRCEHDGSLQNGVEYVMTSPGDLDKVGKALAKLEETYKEHNTRISNSVRAGVHVHINCQELSMSQLLNFMTLYLTLENLLIKFCGDTREGNLFCLRATDAEFILNKIIYAVRNYDFREFGSDELRYASMNVKALTNYGSLEFRAMRGTREFNLIFDWAALLLHLRDRSIAYESPRKIIEEFSEMGPEVFIKSVLGDFYKMFSHLSREDMNCLLYDGMRLSQDIAYCVDWENWEPKFRQIGGLMFPIDADPDEPLEDF